MSITDWVSGYNYKVLYFFNLGEISKKCFNANYDHSAHCVKVLSFHKGEASKTFGGKVK